MHWRRYEARGTRAPAPRDETRSTSEKDGDYESETNRSPPPPPRMMAFMNEKKRLEYSAGGTGLILC